MLVNKAEKKITFSHFPR